MMWNVACMCNLLLMRLALVRPTRFEELLSMPFTKLMADMSGILTTRYSTA